MRASFISVLLTYIAGVSIRVSLISVLTYIAGVSGRVSFDTNADRLTDYALWGMAAQGDSFEFMADIRVDEIEERVSTPNVFFCSLLYFKIDNDY